MLSLLVLVADCFRNGLAFGQREEGVFQSWGGDFERGECGVEREHFAEGSFGAVGDDGGVPAMRLASR